MPVPHQEPQSDQPDPIDRLIGFCMCLGIRKPSEITAPVRWSSLDMLGWRSKLCTCGGWNMLLKLVEVVVSVCSNLHGFFAPSAWSFPHVDQTTSFSPISRRCGMFIFMACTVWRWPWSLAGAVARPPKYYDIPLRKKLSHLLQCWNQGHLSPALAGDLSDSLFLSLSLSPPLFATNVTYINYVLLPWWSPTTWGSRLKS